MQTFRSVTLVPLTKVLEERGVDSRKLASKTWSFGLLEEPEIQEDEPLETYPLSVVTKEV